MRLYSGFLLRFLTVLLFSTCSMTMADQSSNKPNIILIMADDVGYECFGSYGSKQYKTPRLDSLAKTGMRFNHCYAQPLCTPSRVKLMTGMSNIRNYANFSILNPEEKTFGHMLQQAGYKTAIAGKWQLYGAKHYGKFAKTGMHPRDAGFDEYCLWQIDQLGSRFWAPLIDTNGQLKQYDKNTYGPDVFCQFILNFIKKNQSDPFFIYYPMVLVHNPFVPTPDSVNRNSKNKQRNFEDMVTYMDKIVGRIVDQLDQLNLRDNTLILFIGDNGTNKLIRSKLNGKIIKGGKGLTTDAGTRVPMIVNMPTTMPKGKVSDDLIDFNDFMPTLAKLCHAKLPTDVKLDGVSFAPQLQDKIGTPRKWIYCYYHPRPSRKGWKEQRFARNKQWKLYADGRLYDVPRDVLEQHPLNNNNDNAKTVMARKQLQAAMDTMPAKPLKIK